MGPAGTTLLPGEKVAVGVSIRVGRRGRSFVNARIIGASSLAWAEAAYNWGARIDAIVLDNSELSDHVKKLFACAPVLVQDAVKLEPRGPWAGVVFCTLSSDQDADSFKLLFDAWLPGDAVVAAHGDLSRSRLLSWLPKPSGFYKRKISRASHSSFGGVTWSTWHLVHYSRVRDPITATSLMTRDHYAQTLQSSLDDTLPRSGEAYTFEASSGQRYIGAVRLHKTGASLWVYDGESLGPDLAVISKPRFWFFWVRAATVWSKSEAVLRPIRLYELFSVWDYEGKSECKNRSWDESIVALRDRICSPPGKIVRAAAFTLLEAWNSSQADASDVVTNKVGKTEDIPFSPLEVSANVRAEAACPDDAEIDLSIWAPDNETAEQADARVVIRRLAVRWWADFHSRKAHQWLTVSPRTHADHDGVKDCLSRLRACRYFKWPRGSRILFWRIPQDQDHQGWMEDFRDGVKCWQLPGTTLPQGRMRNIPTETREDELLTREKILRLRVCRYLEHGEVKLVVPRFTVPKAGDDVRVVWDSKANGHNACLWAPSFLLGDSGDLEEMIVKWLSMPVGIYLLKGSPDEDYSQDASNFIKSWQADIDVGQQFNNFQAHQEDRPYLGVRIIETQNDGSFERHFFMRYGVLHFGGRNSPWQAGQGQLRILELAKGPPDDLNSACQWERVHLNLPTMPQWDPSLPRVLLLRKDQELASQEADYVDDIHPVARGITSHNAVALAKQLKSRMNSYGNQADDKKYRQPTCRPGAWKGEIIHTDQPFPRKSTTGKKWTRFRSGVSWVLDQASQGTSASTAELRRIAGLGINVTDVYKDARCYLKGFFNAVESFRSDRDANGWRIREGFEGPPLPLDMLDTTVLTAMQMEAAMESAELLEVEDASTAMAQNGYPLLTVITPELIAHCEALAELFEAEEPRAVFLRPSSASKYRYYVGDASREGLGGATQYPDGRITGRRGVWDPVFAEGGSNLREAQNQVNHLLSEVQLGLHDGCALWAFTDNAVWSAVWRKGLSTSRLLFKLVLRLKIACREHEVYLTVCHISGDRMIETGVDGWSRGDFESGVSLGYDLRHYLPLARSAFEVAGCTLIPWLRDWMGVSYKGPLSPEGWFWAGHLPGVHVWIPPPAAALIALRQLGRTRHKRPYCMTHVVLIPRILYWEEWQTRFEKEMDIWFVMHSGNVWPHNAHEPLLVGISFPMYRDYPWLVRLESQKVVEIGRHLSTLSKTSHLRVGDYLRELWGNPRALPPVSGSVVKIPRDFNGASLAEVEDEKRYKVARPGDHLCSIFQCPNCQSQNIRGKDLNPRLAQDAAFEALVIRATLDAFWSHASSTVSNHVSEVRFMSRYGDALGFDPMPSLGPYPLFKHGGMLQALMVLMRSTEKGKKKTTVQYGTARKTRATLTVLWEVSPDSGTDVVLSTGSRKGRYIATLCPSESRWYSQFALGISARMGDVVSQDRAYTIEVLHELLKSYEEEWSSLGTDMPLARVSSCMFLLASSLGGMRGFEVMWTDLAALKYDLDYCEDSGDESAVSWPIVGRFKAHDGVLGCYMIPIAGTTRSGIQFFRWTQRFVGRLALAGHDDGWAFRRKDGTRARASDYMDDIYSRLEHIQATTSLIDPECDVRADYGAQRSGRRFLTTHATKQGVKPHVIELQCRWQTDRAKGERSVTRSMIHLYSEVRNMKDTLMEPSLVC